MPWLVFLSLLFPATLYSEESSNIMLLHDANATAGDVVWVDLEIMNDDQFLSFQLTLPLPDGFYYVANSIELTERARGHQIFANQTQDGLIILSYAFPAAYFDGNDGIIAKMAMHTPTVPGEYLIDIANASIFGAGVNIITGTVSGTITLEEGEPATYDLSFDVMGEHGQSIADAVVTLNDSLYQPGEYQFSGLPPDTYIYMVSRDGYFNATGEVVILDGDVTETVVLHQDDTASQPPDGQALRVYPNPATRQLIVESPGSITIIRLFNPRGLEVYAASPHHTRHTIHTAAYPPGVYYLQVNTAARRITLPVVIAQ